MKRICIVIMAMVAVLSWVWAALAETPLLQEGKKTVFQRVVSNPGAKLFADPSGSMAKESPRTFTTYYVYARQNGMVRVGVSSTGAGGEHDGWLRESDATEWPQAITMVFSDMKNRQPVLFFPELNDLMKVTEAESIRDTVEQYKQILSTPGAPMPKGGPIAMEPDKEAVSQEDFYLLPVISYDKGLDDSGTRILQVACLDPGMPGGEEQEAGGGEPDKKKRRTQSGHGVRGGHHHFDEALHRRDQGDHPQGL